MYPYDFPMGVPPPGVETPAYWGTANVQAHICSFSDCYRMKLLIYPRRFPLNKMVAETWGGENLSRICFSISMRHKCNRFQISIIFYRFDTSHKQISQWKDLKPGFWLAMQTMAISVYTRYYPIKGTVKKRALSTKKTGRFTFCKLIGYHFWKQINH